ncbi:hypothetical protein ACFL5V_04555 [Fibrobacterota bacterium]
MDYFPEAYKELEREFLSLGLKRPMHVNRYEQGTELAVEAESVSTPGRGTVRLVIDKFIGGGYAGQVYKVRISGVEPDEKVIPGLHTGGLYAMKIMVPPTSFSRMFRNLLYRIGFQAAFQLQVNPAAARAGALWQKFIRRAARVRFGDERSVRDIHAVFVDTAIGGCGELSEWLEGRTWRLEVDDRLDLLSKWKKGETADSDNMGSPEYRAKYRFMHDFVDLLHEVGAPEFARQYEWSTWMSQPNCLKRDETEGNPSKGLVAADFRAGLVLLPFLPLGNPGDVKLIVKGLLRGSLVQFDRGDLNKLEHFIKANRGEFSDMLHLLEELKYVEYIYRNSIPDITHNHLRLLYSKILWSTIFKSAVIGWKTQNLIDIRHRDRLLKSRSLTLVFMLLWAVPLLGRVWRKLWGHENWRGHYLGMLTSRAYFKRAVRGRMLESLISWHRAERVEGNHVLDLQKHAWKFWAHFPLSFLPAGIHRILTDWDHLKGRLDHYLTRPVRLYFNAGEREQWLRDLVKEGREDHLLHAEDEKTILSQIKEPFIQKYLKSLAVHVCTLPVTQVVSLIVAGVYVATHPELPRAQAYGIGLGIIALFQVTPISPGSLVRGLYVLYLVIRERNFKDYNIAVFLGFFKYVGYLAFPIQMYNRYPALARFMASRWATDFVHIIPVFGERGALLEHKVFQLCYNWPLTIRRRMDIYAQIRRTVDPRYWHYGIIALAGSALFSAADVIFENMFGRQPALSEIWWLACLAPLACGAAATLGAGGSALRFRVAWGAVCGAGMGFLYTAMSAILGGETPIHPGDLAVNGLWRIFVFTIVSTAGVLITEINLPEPRQQS